MSLFQDKLVTMETEAGLQSNHPDETLFKKKTKTLKLFLKKTKQSIQQVSLRGPGFFMVGVVVSSQEGAVLQKENRCHMMYSVN